LEHLLRGNLTRQLIFQSEDHAVVSKSATQLHYLKYLYHQTE